MAALIETDGHPPDEQPWLALVAALPVGLALAAPAVVALVLLILGARRAASDPESDETTPE